MAKKTIIENTYKVTLQDGALKIYINGLIHMSLKQEELIGFKSWFENSRAKRQYYIEYSLRESTMLLEYNCFERWKFLLTELDKLNLY
jgi:hypothetical protein